MKYLIGVDLGTSGTKTVLFDEKGAVISQKQSNIHCIRRKTAGQSKSLQTGGMPPEIQLNM